MEGKEEEWVEEEAAQSGEVERGENKIEEVYNLVNFFQGMCVCVCVYNYDLFFNLMYNIFFFIYHFMFDIIE